MADLGKLYTDAKEQGGAVIWVIGFLGAMGAAVGIRKATKATVEDDVDELKVSFKRLQGQLTEMQRMLASVQMEQAATNQAAEQDRIDARSNRQRQLQIISNLEASMRENFQEAIRGLTEHHGPQKA